MVNLAVCVGDLERYVNGKYTALEKRIQTAWEQYMSDEWFLPVSSGPFPIFQHTS